MKTLFILSAIFLGNFLTPVHDVPIAIFHITESNAVLNIDIVFDLEDFSNSLELETSEIELEDVQNYLSENTNFLFNDQVANLKISEVKIIRDHIKLRGNFGKLKRTIKKIKIENSCLNNVPHHSNVIQIDLNNKSKDYRMHKKRTVINLEY
jgi:hypothetical protein